MVARVRAIAFDGVLPCDIDVELKILSGLPSFTLVGLADKAVAESRERVRSALSAVGLAFPAKRVTVNLAPADFPKEGSHYDLPIALALMIALEIIPQQVVDSFVAVGELGLDGSLRPISGILPAAIAANAQGRGLICPVACGSEAAWADANIEILAAPDLSALIGHFLGRSHLKRPEVVAAPAPGKLPDLREVKGQELAKRALEVAAAGGHNMLMVGPPGSGKSMLASRLPSILPLLTPAEVLEVSMIHSVGGFLSGGALSQHPPFRSPHHSISMAALVGGGHKGRPGEVSLSHLGVLFLDEFAEFTSHVLDALRQPLETGEVMIARANHRTVYPARFQLIAAMNPCKCGLAGTAGHICARGQRCVTDYQARISGPLLDRIDLRIELAAVSASDLVLPAPAEGSAEVALRVAAARKRQKERFTDFGEPKIRVNSACSVDILEKIAELDGSGKDIMQLAINRLSLSARAYHRVLKVARTIADLDGSERILRPHLAEALSYRTVAGMTG